MYASAIAGYGYGAQARVHARGFELAEDFFQVGFYVYFHGLWVNVERFPFGFMQRYHLFTKLPKNFQKLYGFSQKPYGEGQNRTVLYGKLSKTLRRVEFTSIRLFCVVPLHQKNGKVKSENGKLIA
jgi:hypothetical protein